MTKRIPHSPASGQSAHAADIGALALQLLERQAADFEQTVHFRDGFFAHLSRASRSALTLIQGPLEQVLAGAHGGLAPRQHEQLVYAAQHARRLSWIVEQIDEIALFDTGRCRPEPHRQDLRAFLERLIRRFERPASWRRIGLHFEAPPGPIPRSFPPSAFSKAFTHLIAFSLKHTEAGGRVTVRLAPDELYPAASVTVLVGTDRPALAPDALRARFDALSATTASAADDESSLGLFVARELVRRSGGKVVLRPQHGGFAVQLPPGLPEAQAPPAPSSLGGDALPPAGQLGLFEPVLHVREPTPTQPLHTDRHLLLLVSDSPGLRSYLRARLGQYHVVEAAAGHEALRLIRHRRPDLVVCGLTLPDMGAGDLLRALKADALLADIGFIVLANRPSEELKVNLLEAGAAEYLIEPLRAGELQAKIHNLLAFEAREKEALDLAHQAQLQMLRYQLNPHFLFNALNAIRALVISDAARAREMVTALSEYLRYSLLTANDLEISLEEELTSVSSYLDIERIRFEDDLDVHFDVEPEATGCRVPSVLLQPLVENAIKYGMLTSAMPLRLRIEAHLRAGTLRLAVANTGRWLQAGTYEEISTGIGLRNLRQRLERFYPGRHHFEVAEAEGWVQATLTIDLEEDHEH